jgi:hypothetical protein
VLLEIKEISVAMPIRKKCDICFTKNHIYARASGTAVPLPGTTYTWKNIGESCAAAGHCVLRETLTASA